VRSNLTKASEVALNFIKAINNHDLKGLEALMAEDHKFIDGLGSVVVGRTAMRDGWDQYFKMFPDYQIEIQNMLENSSTVGFFGTASGTFSGKSNVKKAWRIPASWRALIKNGLVEEWQVYADNEPVWKIMGVKRY
jgi:ketosteroid isomerase-like protein